MSIFRRHTMKGNGKINTSQLPDWFNEHVVCWYSPVLQGCTNDSLTADPTLYDLSGKGCDMTLNQPTEINVSSGALLFDATSMYGSAITPNLTDFTILWHVTEFKRKGNYSSLATKINVFGIGNTVYVGDVRYGNTSFGTTTSLISAPPTIGYMTPTDYCGILELTRGEAVDLGGELWLFKGLPTNRNIIGYGRLHDFILFDITLTPEQIEWVKTNIITD